MELAGRGLPQARENLKKLRGLVRRIQNRGYATLERIVEHFSELVAGGDESNAIIDAVDAVNLMTVHAAKGLEFPVVFVVNVGRGSGGGRDPIRVVAGDEQRSVEPMVGIGDHETEADADADARDGEESKRLLYVALTRARDRLYLAGVVDAHGRLAPAKGSLARHLPVSLLETFAVAGSQPELRWTGPSAAHYLRALTGVNEMVRWTGAPAESAAPVQDFAAVAPDGVPRVVASMHSSASVPAETAIGATPSSRGIGTLVHRLLALANRRGMTDPRELEQLADALAPGSLDVEVSESERRRAVATVGRLLASPDLRLRGESRFVFEAPYSRRLGDGRIERGTIDCLVFDGDAIDVLEFKTGSAQAEHSAQLDAYVEAVRAAYPGQRVGGRLVYVAP
jgi:ATP-dependent helicase/nuclease subunit A